MRLATMASVAVPELEALARLALLPEGHAAQKEAQRYLGELAQMPLDVIEQQPAQQAANVSMLQHQLADVCMRNTPMFVEAQSAFYAVPRCAETCSGALARISGEHATHIQAAAAAFEQDAQRALARRTALLQLEETYDTSLHHLLQIPLMIRAYIARGDDDDALALVDHFFGAIPSEDRVAEALRDEVHTALLTMRVRLLAQLEEPQQKLPQVRRIASALAQAAKAAPHFSASALAMAPADVCGKFLAARYRVVQSALRTDTTEDALDGWKEAVLNACTAALSVFGSDTPSAMLTASFGAQCVHDLQAYLEARLASFDGAHEEGGVTLATLHSRLASVSASCAQIGLDLDATPGVYVPLEQAALRQWTSALSTAIAPSHDVPATSAGIAAALNGLRHFAPLSLEDAVWQSLALRLDDAAAWLGKHEAYPALLSWSGEQLAALFGAEPGRLASYSPTLQAYLATRTARGPA